MFSTDKQSRKRMISINRNIIFPELNAIQFNNNARSIEIIELDSDGKERNTEDVGQTASNTNHDLYNRFDNEEIVNAQYYYQQLYNKTKHYGSMLQDVIADIYRESRREDEISSTTDIEYNREFENCLTSSSSEDNAQYCTYNSHREHEEDDLPNVDYAIDYYFRKDSSFTLSPSSSDEDLSHKETTRVSTPITMEETKRNVSSLPSLPTVIEIAEPIYINIISKPQVTDNSSKKNWIKSKPDFIKAPAVEIERYFSWIPLVLNDRNKIVKKKFKTRTTRVTPYNDVNNNIIHIGVQVEIHEIKGDEEKKENINANTESIHDQDINLEDVVEKYDIYNILEDLESQNIERNIETEETNKYEKSEIENIVCENIANTCIDLSTSNSTTLYSFRVNNTSCVPSLHLSYISKDKRNVSWLQKALYMCCPWLTRHKRANDVSHKVSKELKNSKGG